MSRLWEHNTDLSYGVKKIKLKKNLSTLCVIIEEGLDANKIQCANSKVKTIGVVLLKLF